MSDQQKLLAEPGEYYYVFYREIRAEETSLTEKKFTGHDAENIQSLLNDVFTSGGGQHELDELDTATYFDRWVRSLLDESREVTEDDDISSTVIQDLRDLAENFSENMQTRARAAGKYVVIILTEERLIICHSYTGKRALTTDMEIIEELLSADNIDKYAEFHRADESIIVNHFDKYDTQSFVNWLGIPPEDVVFDIKGDVRVYSEIAEIEAIFEFSRNDIVEKIIQSDEYDLDRGLLETPGSDSDYRVNRIRWGHDTYTDTEEFKDEALTLHYQLKYYDDKYDELTENVDLFTKKVRDKETEVSMISNGSEETHVRKEHTDLSILFVNQHIDIQPVWLKTLADSALRDDDPVPIYHAGNRFSEDPYRIGSLRIYNELELSPDQQEYMQDLVETAQDLGTGNLENMLGHILFKLAGQASTGPITYFFDSLAAEFDDRHRETLSEGTRIMQTEGEAVSLEFKSAEWFLQEDSDTDLAEKIYLEFQKGARLLLGGIDEDGQKIKTIQKNRFNSERLAQLEDIIEQKYDAEDIHIWTVPIDSGDVTIAALNVET